jgi:RNA polymerase sigma-70 factor (ECF subfamily)
MADNPEAWPLTTTTFVFKAKAWLEQIKYVALRLERAWADKVDRSGLLQEAWVKAWKNRHSCHATTEAHARNWVVMIYVRTLLDALRKKYVRNEANETETNALSGLAVETTGPLGQLEKREEEARVRATLATLREEQQVVLTLHYFEGMSLVDIADLLGETHAAIRQRIHRAREALRKKLSGCDREEDPGRDSDEQ